MNQKHLPSFAVVLIDDQDTIWQHTFGVADLEANTPAELNTVYRLWSVAKVFTAIETLRLVEDGLVDLDIPITKYIPSLSIQSCFPDSEPITIRSPLTHRSGLPRNGCHWVELTPNVLALKNQINWIDHSLMILSQLTKESMYYDLIDSLKEEKTLYLEYLEDLGRGTA